MKISIVMPIWVINDELFRLTREAIDSLKTSDEYGDTELIIVDNASDVGVLEWETAADIYIRNDENLGYPVAVNQGVAKASGDLIAIANNDIRVSPNWITITKEIFNAMDHIGSLHFKMVDYDAPFALGNEVTKKGRERWCTGSFFVWDSMALDEMFGAYGFIIDPHYGLGGYDDWDWQHRMRDKLGWATVYTNAAAYQHKDSTSQNLRDPQERTEQDNKNYEYFKKKWGDYPDIIWARQFPEQMDVPWKPFP